MNKRGGILSLKKEKGASFNMSRSPSNSQSDSEQNQPHQPFDSLPKFSDKLLLSPTLTSYGVEWSSASLEYYCQPAGETPKICLDHYVIGIHLGQDCHLEWQIDEVAKGRLQKKMVSSGFISLLPMQYSRWARWDRQTEALMLNLEPHLLTRNAAELLAVDQVELLPQTSLDDPLIVQIGLALKADLESHRPGGRLYAETLTNALAVHLLRNYSAHSHKSVHYLGGLSPTQLRLVMDYINDHLDQELSLDELAAIVQLSAFHFCRSFKRSTGFTPHQYVIRQRVERAKLLLKDGKMGIAEVAVACGFTHQSHLNRHFKRLTGITPKIFSKS